ncbi:MAG TPA: DUF2284 domain-containing protein [Patescibacteria group bacterium]|nr:DUF2284 domain-containing protein [Patescibacteria group bacterium]
MKEVFNGLIQSALDLKASHAGIAQVSQLQFVRDFRTACEQNVCGNYNASWVCPPAIGTFDEVMNQALQFKQGLLFQTVHQIANSVDVKGMFAAKKIHDGTFRKILDRISTMYRFSELLPLNAGSCEFCSRCAYLDHEKCRSPENAFASVEAYGIDVFHLETALGIPYDNGENTVSYVGLILFKD